MTKFNIKQILNIARKRLKKAFFALSSKDKSKGWEEYNAARADVLSLERQLAKDSNLEYLESFGFPVEWNTGAPTPQLLTNRNHTFLVFYVKAYDPDWDGTYVKVMNPKSDKVEQIAIVDFQGCLSAKLGDPNDEVFSGHPLYNKGFESYTAQIVHNSKWIKELEEINKVHSEYKPELWHSFNHYLFWFHDEIFECVAKSYNVEVVNDSMPNIIQQLAKRLLD